MCSVTRVPHTCSITGPTSGPCRNCSATHRSARPRCTPGCRQTGCSPCTGTHTARRRTLTIRAAHGDAAPGRRGMGPMARVSAVPSGSVWPWLIPSRSTVRGAARGGACPASGAGRCHRVGQLRRELRRLRPGGRRTGRGQDAGRGSLQDQLDDVEAALAKLRRRHLRPLRAMPASPSATPASRPCPRPGSASSTPSSPAGRGTEGAPVPQAPAPDPPLRGLVWPGGPSAEDDGWAREQLTEAEADLWTRMSGPDRRHTVAVARRVDERLGEGATACRSSGRPAARRRQDGGRARDLRAGRADAFGRGRRRGHRPAVDRRVGGFTRRVGLHVDYPALGVDLLRVGRE